MDVITWLLDSNDNIKYLVQTQLLEKNQTQKNNEYIKKYLDLYDLDTKMWGNGLYGPKWISSTYTLLDLINLKAHPDDKMIEAYHKLRDEIVMKYTLNPNDDRTLDLCNVGMLIRIGAYLNDDEKKIKELIDFVLLTVNQDGAWNCYFNYRPYKTSSLHTTINVLEGLLFYIENGYNYRLDEIKKTVVSAQEFLLKKKLFRSRRTNQIIDTRFIEIHYPTRWFYDLFRVLEYFADAKVRYDNRMEEGLTIARNSLLKGPLPKGKSYAGKLHFKYELEDYKRINTLRALKIVKQYDTEFYNNIINNLSFKV